MTITRHQLRLIDAANAIQQDPLAADISYLARLLVLATLPHANPGDVPLWTRTNGNLTLAIPPGQEKGRLVGYPYGTIPRLLLFWITTEAVRTRQRRLQLGDSLADFMRQLGLDPNNGSTGAKRSDAHRLRDQMKRLFLARISFDRSTEQSTRWLNMEVAPMGELWWDAKAPGQAALFGSWIELGEKFFEAVTASPVPVDLRALKALKRSPLALDLYAWSTYRTWTVNRAGQSQFIPWRGLMQQMGADYGDPSNFRKKVKGALRKIQLVFPALRIDFTPGGFIIHPGRPAVTER